MFSFDLPLPFLGEDRERVQTPWAGVAIVRGHGQIQ